MSLKIGIVGCGLQSHYHINFACSYPGATIVGIVDKEIESSRRAAKAYDIPDYFENLGDLITSRKPDVVHVVTPPRSHLSLTQEALERGCHVLVEKPFTLNKSDAQFLFDLADKIDRQICVVHNNFFDPCMIRARKLVQEGAVGRIVGVESYFGLNTRIDGFRKYSAPNVVPWIYSLPAGPYFDVMAHPLYIMLPFIGKIEKISAMEKSFGELPHGIPDELRVLIHGQSGLGVMSLSFATKPHNHILKIYGTKAHLQVDFNTMTTTLQRTSRLPKAAQRAVANFSKSWQLSQSTTKNIWNFLRGRLKPSQGLETLIHKFYDAIKEKGPNPVKKEEILAVVEAMDEICKQIKPRELKFDPIVTHRLPIKPGSKGKVLVTGATGYLGTQLVEFLLQKNYFVRALARKLSNIEKLKKLGVEIYFGDVASRESLIPAFEGIEYVVHAAADTTGDKLATELGTVLGTKNVVDLCTESKIRRLVYISSCSVYGVGDLMPGQVAGEDAPLERFSEKRGAYSHGKSLAESIIRDTMEKGGVPTVCLRPGIIFGPGGDTFSPTMGLSLGTKAFVIIGNGRFKLPLVFIDNLVEAIIATIDHPKAEGRIYNVVDPSPITKKDYVDLFLDKLYPKAYKVYLPYSLLYTIVFLQEIICKVAKRRPFLTRYRLSVSQKSITYDSSKIQSEVGFAPANSIREGLQIVLDQSLEKR